MTIRPDPSFSGDAGLKAGRDLQYPNLGPIGYFVNGGDVQAQGRLFLQVQVDSEGGLDFLSYLRTIDVPIAIPQTGLGNSANLMGQHNGIGREIGFPL